MANILKKIYWTTQFNISRQIQEFIELKEQKILLIVSPRRCGKSYLINNLMDDNNDFFVSTQTTSELKSYNSVQKSTLDDINNKFRGEFRKRPVLLIEGINSIATLKSLRKMNQLCWTNQIVIFYNRFDFAYPKNY